MPGRALAALALVVSIASGYAASAAAAEVDVLLAEEGPAYFQAAEAARDEIGQRATVQFFRPGAWDPARRKPDVLLVLGTQALQTAMRQGPGGPPVVATLLPRAAYDRAVRAAPRPGEGRVSAVFLDQPAARQLNLVRAMLPGKTRVGVLRGAEGDELVPPLRAAAREQRLTLREEAVPAPGELHAALVRLLPDVDALLATPEPDIFNAGTIHNILVTTYRARQPVFGFSAAYVRAGALAAVYSTPRQVGRQAGEMAVRALSGGPLPAPQFPNAFGVSVNPTVARSLDLATDDEAALAQRLMRMERN